MNPELAGKIPSSSLFMQTFHLLLTFLLSLLLGLPGPVTFQL